MAVRKDSVQITVDIEAAQGVREFQKFTDEVKRTEAQMRKLKKAGKENSEEYKTLQKNLDKVNEEFAKIGGAGATMGQLIGRAKKLNREIKSLAPGTTRFIQATKELREVNTRLIETREKTKGVRKGLDKMRGGVHSVRKAFMLLQRAVVILAAIKAAFDFTKEIFNAAKEAEFMQRKFEIVFGTAGKLVTDFAKLNAEKMGLTISQYKKAAAAAGDLLIPMGFQRTEAAQLSALLTNLSGPLSHWTAGQISTTEVGDILTKSLLGEREQLKLLGIAISEADVKQRLATKGQEKFTGQALQQAKALATLELITEKSADAQTDFKESGDGLAKSQAQILTTYEKIKGFLAKHLIPVFAFWLKWVNKYFETVEFLFFAFTDNLAGVKAAVNQAIDNFKSGFQSMILSAQIMAKELELALTFDDAAEARLQSQIASLKSLKSAAAESGRTIGEAYADARDKAMNSRKRQTGSTAAPTIAPITINPNQGGGGTNTPTDDAALDIELEKITVQEVAKLETLKIANLEQQSEVERQLQMQEDAHRMSGENLLKDKKRLAEEEMRIDQEITDFKSSMEDARRNLALQGLAGLKQILGKDEKARKKNAKILKAIALGEVAINLQKELSAIATSNASTGPFAAFIVPVLQAAAVVRAGLATAKITGVGFYDGGFTGSKSLYQDAWGHHVAGFLSNGQPHHVNEWVAPEWMTSDPNYSGIIHGLEAARQKGKFEGGFTADATTPNAPLENNSTNNFDFAQISKAFEKSATAMVQAIERKQFGIYSGQLISAIDEENTLEEDSLF